MSFGFWVFCTMCETSLLMTFRNSQSLPFSLVIRIRLFINIFNEDGTRSEFRNVVSKLEVLFIWPVKMGLTVSSETSSVTLASHTVQKSKNQKRCLFDGDSLKSKLSACQCKWVALRRAVEKRAKRSRARPREGLSGSDDLFCSEDGGSWFLRQWGRCVFSMRKNWTFKFYLHFIGSGPEKVEFVVDKVALDQVYRRVIWFTPACIIVAMFHTHLQRLTLTEGSAIPEHFATKVMICRKSGRTRRRSTFIVFNICFYQKDERALPWNLQILKF